MKHVIFLLIILFCSCANAQSRRDRTVDPTMIVPNARMVPNNTGGYNYYKDGKLVAKSNKNIQGSYDIYVKGRLKYKGAHYGNTNSTRYNSRSSGRPSQIETRRDREKLEDYLERWSRQRQSLSRGHVYWWEHYYPQYFRN